MFMMYTVKKDKNYMSIDYKFLGHQPDHKLLYFDDMKFHTCVCMYDHDFTIEKLIDKIKARQKLFII